MATNKIGPNTKTIGINMPTGLANAIEAKAKSMNISTSKYVKVILSQWVKSKKRLVLSE